MQAHGAFSTLEGQGAFPPDEVRSSPQITCKHVMCLSESQLEKPRLSSEVGSAWVFLRPDPYSMSPLAAPGAGVRVQPRCTGLVLGGEEARPRGAAAGLPLSLVAWALAVHLCVCPHRLLSHGQCTHMTWGLTECPGLHSFLV